jgi:hypothetical protein
MTCCQTQRGLAAPLWTAPTGARGQPAGSQFSLNVIAKFNVALLNQPQVDCHRGISTRSTALHLQHVAHHGSWRGVRVNACKSNTHRQHRKQSQEYGSILAKEPTPSSPRTPTLLCASSASTTSSTATSKPGVEGSDRDRPTSALLIRRWLSASMVGTSPPTACGNVDREGRRGVRG